MLGMSKCKISKMEARKTYLNLNLNIDCSISDLKNVQLATFTLRISIVDNAKTNQLVRKIYLNPFFC